MSGRVLIGLAVLAVFGMLYNRLIHWVIVDLRWTDFTAWQVVGGVLATVGGWWWMTGDDAGTVLMLCCFAASGLPMTVGSWLRRKDGGDGGDWGASYGDE